MLRDEEHALRLDVDDQPHCAGCADRDARIQRLVATIEDLAEKQQISDATTKKWYRTVLNLQDQLRKQQRDDEDQPIVQAVFGFWKALKGTNVRLGPARTKAILERTRDDPPVQPKEFIWPILGLVCCPTPKMNGGVGHYDDLELALRDDKKMYDYEQRGRGEVGASGLLPRALVHEVGGDAAVAALDVLLALQAEMYPPAPAT